MYGNRGNWKAVGLLVVVFVLGLALGGVGTHAYFERVRAQADSHGRSDHAKIFDDLTRELDLTADQQKQLSTILEENRARFQAIYEQVRPQYDAARVQGRDRIRAILTAEQRPKFEDFLRRLDEQRKNRSTH
jgi:hypothetical protein